MRKMMTGKLIPEEESDAGNLNGKVDERKNAAAMLRHRLHFCNIIKFILPAVLLPIATFGDPFVDGDVVVFVGDSITHGGRYYSFISDFYRARYSDRSIRFVNSGYGGGTIGGVLPRIEEDVVEYNPTWVMLNFGANDTNRDAYRLKEKGTIYLDARLNSLKRFRDNFHKVTAKLHEVVPNAKLIYAAPCTYDDGCRGDSKDECQGCGAGISFIAASMLQFSRDDKVPFVNWYSMTREFLIRHQEKDPAFTVYYGDRTHLNPTGHELLAWEFLKTQGVSPLVSSVEIDVKTCSAKAENAEVSDLSAVSGDGVRFSLLAKSLPCPISDDAKKYAEEFEFVKYVSHEGLKVAGLADGDYELKIDGRKVGKYSSADLANGIELALNNRTPQFAQAIRVREANERLRKREYEFRGFHYARNHYRTRTNVDDMPTLKAWAEENLGENAAKWDKVFAPFVKGYLEYWPKHRELRDRLWHEQDAVRKLAKPTKHEYALIKLTK